MFYASLIFDFNNFSVHVIEVCICSTVRLYMLYSTCTYIGKKVVACTFQKFRRVIQLCILRMKYNIHYTIPITFPVDVVLTLPMVRTIYTKLYHF